MISTQAKHVITTSRNDKEIYGYLTKQPLSVLTARNPHLLTLIKETVSELNLVKPIEYIERDMGRNIGYCEVVATTEKDTIFYAHQLRSKVYTRFVKNRPAELTTNLTMMMKRDEDGNYEVVRVSLGNNFPPVPGEEDATKDSESYWQGHAVVYNGQQLVSRTLTKDWPF